MTQAEKEIDWIDRDEPFENEDAIEGEEDLKINKGDFDELIVAPSDWTVGTLYSQIGNQIDLDPAFQRRNVWSTKSKSRFIESLFLGVPIPQILLAARKGHKSSFIVLDGKQRLITIKEFIEGRLENGRAFRLREMRVLKELDGKTWEDIRQDADIADRLLNETLRTAVLRGWRDERLLYEIFHRLNSGSVRLSPMELRMSLYPGNFLKFIISWTENIGPIHHLLRKKKPDNRMSDVELAVRFLAFDDNSFEYPGNLKEFLDECAKVYNEKFDRGDEFQHHINRRLDEMNSAIDVGLDVFGDNFCKKYIGEKYERRFNRAISDVLIGSLSRPEVREWVSSNPKRFVSTYEELCMTNGEFVKSIESTTKTTTATRARFSAWYRALRESSGIEIAIPNIRP